MIFGAFRRIIYFNYCTATCPGGLPLKLDLFAVNLILQLPITDKTRKNYLGAYRRYLKIPIGDLNLTEITKQDIVNAIALLPEQTKYQTLMVIRVIFREAFERELVLDNPTTTIRIPKITVKPQKFLKWEELREIDFGYQTQRIRFLALHGLRYGEAAALSNADIRNNRVYVNKSKYGSTKTPSGVRSVPLMSEFQQFPLYQDAIAKALKPYGVTVHSLRKTYAYMLKQSNVHVTTAAKLLGHSNPMITLRIYTQVLDSEIDESGTQIRDYMKLAV